MPDDLFPSTAQQCKHLSTEGDINGSCPKHCQKSYMHKIKMPIKVMLCNFNRFLLKQAFRGLYC